MKCVCAHNTFIPLWLAKKIIKKFWFYSFLFVFTLEDFYRSIFSDKSSIKHFPSFSYLLHIAAPNCVLLFQAMNQTKNETLLNFNPGKEVGGMK